MQGVLPPELGFFCQVHIPDQTLLGDFMQAFLLTCEFDLLRSDPEWQVWLSIFDKGQITSEFLKDHIRGVKGHHFGHGGYFSSVSFLFAVNMLQVTISWLCIVHCPTVSSHHGKGHFILYFKHPPNNCTVLRRGSDARLWISVLLFFSRFCTVLDWVSAFFESAFAFGKRSLLFFIRVIRIILIFFCHATFLKRIAMTLPSHYKTPIMRLIPVRLIHSGGAMGMARHGRGWEEASAFVVGVVLVFWVVGVVFFHACMIDRLRPSLRLDFANPFLNISIWHGQWSAFLLGNEPILDPFNYRLVIPSGRNDFFGSIVSAVHMFATLDTDSLLLVSRLQHI